MGVGNELDGDDSAGLLVVRRLRSLVSENEQIKLIEAGVAPENFTAPIIRFQPDWVLVVDSARMGAHPGAVSWIELDEVGDVGAGTHGLSLSMVGRYLSAETGCQFNLLGIQLVHTGFDQPVSAAVHAAVERVAVALALALR